MGMHNRMKKEEFLAAIANIKNPRLNKLHVRVLLIDDEGKCVEIYCASNWREESYGAAWNAYNKYSKWMKEAKA